MIRDVQRGEIPACVSLIRESFRTVAAEFGITPENAPRYVAFATTEERLYRQLDIEKRPMAVYSSDEGVIGGYYSLRRGDDGVCELNNLCVLPRLRHRGIGAALLCDALRRARSCGCTRMELGIVEENTRLRAWYEGFGFVHTGIRKFDFLPFTCGYMERPLPP